MRRIYLILILCICSSVAFTQSYTPLIPFHKGNLWGMSDINGQLKIPAVYDSVSFFSTTYSRDKGKIINYSIVILKGKYGVIDDNDSTVIPCDFISMDDIYITASKKLFIVRNATNKYGVMSAEKIIIEPMYDTISNVDGDYLLLKKNNKFGIADMQGNLIIPAEQDLIKQVSTNSREAVWKLISATETKIIKSLTIHDETESGSSYVSSGEGFASVITDKEYDYDKELAALKAKYTVFCLSYDRNLCYCMKDGKTGFANIAKNKRVPPIYDQVQAGYVSFNENLLIVKLRGMYGLTDEDGKVLVPVKYKYISVSPHKTGVFNIESFDGQYGFYFPNTGKFIAPKYTKVTGGESVYTNARLYKDFKIMYISDGKSSFYVGENGLEFKE